MEEKEKRVVLIVLLFVISIIILTLLFSTMKKDKKTTKKESYNVVEKDKKVKETKKEKQEEKTISYINYTSSDILLKDYYSNSIKGNLKIAINKGILSIKINEEDITISGIDESIKSFTYDKDAYLVSRANNGVFILLLSDKNTLYTGFYEDGDTELYFGKINTNLEIENITYTEVAHESKKTPTNSIKVGAVLKNNEIRPIIETEKEGIFNLSDKDSSGYEKLFDNLLIYNDGTISSVKDNNKLKYEDNDIIVNKILSLEVSDNLKCYYIISNNNIYKLCGTYNYSIPSKFNQIEKLDKTILSTTNLNSGYYENGMNYIITYEDNTKEELNILSAYIR